MSMKIYNAFKLKDPARLWPLLGEIKATARKNVYKRFRAFYQDQMERIDPGSVAYAEAKASLLRYSHVAPDGRVRLTMVQERLRTKAKESATSMERGEYDLAVSVSVMQHEGQFYLRAWCDRVSLLGGSLDFLKKHPELEDFHYQNQTDRPDEVSEEAWEHRRVTWEALVNPETDCIDDYLSLEISDYGAFWKLDPWLEIAREHTENPPVFPIQEEVMARHLRGLQAFTEVVATKHNITGKTIDGLTVVIERGTKKAHRGQWISHYEGHFKRHASLQKAVDYTYTEFLSPVWKETVKRWRKEALDKKKAEKAKRKAKRRPRASICPP